MKPCTGHFLPLSRSTTTTDWCPAKGAASVRVLRSNRTYVPPTRSSVASPAAVAVTLANAAHQAGICCPQRRYCALTTPPGGERERRLYIAAFPQRRLVAAVAVVAA
jgi:hypothetical protein